MKTTLIKIGIVCLFCLSVSFSRAQSPQHPAKPVEAKFPEAGAYSKSTIVPNIISSANNTYGYDIIADGKMIIHQPSVPGMPGNEGFKTRESAEKVAQLVITKIKKGEMPPTVTKEDMQKLKAIK